MRCQNCRNYAQELFPGKLEGEVKQLCIYCVPKCEHAPYVCGEPIDCHASQFYCTAHALEAAKWDLARCDDPRDAAEFEGLITELSGRTELARAA